MWKILIVDDNSENRQLLVEILRDMAQCTAVSGGKEAIEEYGRSLTKEPYHLILLDIEMPEIDGLEILRNIRENEKSRGIDLGDGIPVIMVTVHKKPFLNAFYQGCTDYILKPIDPDKLRKKIQEKLDKFNSF
ncbi:MAG TPA: response regulator [Candidatus Omnitrophota bacterium]|nr:response regulator [Candidatus Omnitrophota bacterium]HPD85462.1 response regulator [Candidatus Omnitrophota bacterium]HRZ04037.1 response regulator [Candidatus Omnitrophota bacterium]